MIRRTTPSPLPTTVWEGGGVVASAVTVPIRGVFGPKDVPCVRFDGSITFRAADVLTATEGRAHVLETIPDQDLAYLVRADRVQKGSAMDPLTRDRAPGDWVLALTTEYDDAVAHVATFTAAEFASLGAWLRG